MTGSRVLVTGGSGFVGAHLMAALARRGDKVRVLARAPLSPPPGAEVETERGDVRDEAACSRALLGASAVVHLAASLRGDDREMRETNVEATRGLARAARQAGVPRFVHLSTAGVYGDSGEEKPLTEEDPPAPVNPYQRSKLESERALVETLAGSGVAWTILRPFGIYGPGRPRSVEFFREVRRKRVWFYGPTRVTLHPTYVGDVVQALLSALDGVEGPGVNGEVFNIGGERPLEHFEFVRFVADRLGVHPIRVAVPSGLAPALRVLGRWGVPRAARFGRPAVLYAADTSKARQALAFAPEPLALGVEATVEWARSAGLL